MGVVGLLVGLTFLAVVFLASGEAAAAHPDNGLKATAAFVGWCVAALIPVVGLVVLGTLIVRALRRRRGNKVVT
jgi:hypothetical protein